MSERLPTPERPTAESLDQRVEAATYPDHQLAKDIARELPTGWSSNMSRLPIGETSDVDVDELVGEIHALTESPYITDQARAWAAWLGNYVVANVSEAGELRGGEA